VLVLGALLVPSFRTYDSRTSIETSERAEQSV
jgi:hypothetical protein